MDGSMPKSPQADEDAPVLLDAGGRRIKREKVSHACPRCGAGPEKRVKSAAFGGAHPVCRTCGYEWMDEVWRD